jgi:hypothetical protein
MIHYDEPQAATAIDDIAGVEPCPVVANLEQRLVLAGPDEHLDAGARGVVHGVFNSFARNFEECRRNLRRHPNRAIDTEPHLAGKTAAYAVQELF